MDIFGLKRRRIEHSTYQFVKVTVSTCDFLLIKPHYFWHDEYVQGFLFGQIDRVSSLHGAHLLSNRAITSIVSNTFSKLSGLDGAQIAAECFIRHRGHNDEFVAAYSAGTMPIDYMMGVIDMSNPPPALAQAHRNAADLELHTGALYPNPPKEAVAGHLLKLLWGDVLRTRFG